MHGVWGLSITLFFVLVAWMMTSELTRNWSYCLANRPGLAKVMQLDRPIMEGIVARYHYIRTENGPPVTGYCQQKNR